MTALDPFDTELGLADDDPTDPYAPEHWYDGADPDTWGGPDIDPNWFDTQDDDRGER